MSEPVREINIPCDLPIDVMQFLHYSLYNPGETILMLTGLSNLIQHVQNAEGLPADKKEIDLDRVGSLLAKILGIMPKEPREMMLEMLEERGIRITIRSRSDYPALSEHIEEIVKNATKKAKNEDKKLEE